MIKLQNIFIPPAPYFGCQPAVDPAKGQIQAPDDSIFAVIFFDFLIRQRILIRLKLGVNDIFRPKDDPQKAAGA
jgi:hypothetical protein